MFFCLGTLALLAASAATTQAALIAYENFDYATSTPIAGLNGGTGWAGAWTTSGTSLGTAIADESLWFGQDPVRIIDGTAHVGLNNANGYSNSRDLGTAIPLSSETLYFAMLFRVDGSTAASITASFQRNDGLARGTVRVDDGNLLVDASTDGFVSGAGGLYTTAQNYLLVAKRVGTADGGGIFASVILGDENPPTLASEPVSWQVSEVGLSGIDVARMTLSIDGGGSVTRLDEIRIATDWDSAVAGLVEPAAVPEPATMCALGLAVAGLGGYVRKRRKA